MEQQPPAQKPTVRYFFRVTRDEIARAAAGADIQAEVEHIIQMAMTPTEQPHDQIFGQIGTTCYTSMNQQRVTDVLTGLIYGYRLAT